LDCPTGGCAPCEGESADEHVGGDGSARDMSMARDDVDYPWREPAFFNPLGNFPGLAYDQLSRFSPNIRYI
jgi:hypothetical protein